MKKICFLTLALTLLTANIGFAADEIHWTVTGQNSVAFDWLGTTTEKTIGYGLTSGVYTQVTATTPNPVPVSSKGPFWEATLTGLKENTLYYYSIGNGPERSFRTPPPRGSSSFNVYALGNIGSTSTYFNTGAVQDIIANDLPSFVVGLGDLTLGSINGKATIDQHFNDVMVWSQQAAYMPVWGDSETVTSTNDNFKNYKGRFAVPNSQTSPGSPLAGGKDWYWFDYGNVRFITLPEPWTGAWADWNTKASALMAQAQADPTIKFIVTFVHRAAYSSGHYAGNSTLKNMLDKLGDTYSKYDLNINAYSNNYERSFPQHGVTHVTVGTGGANLSLDGTCLWKTCTKPAWSAFRAMHLGALKLHFNANGIEGAFICGPSGGGTNDIGCTKGSVIDSFVIGSPEITAVSATNITPTTANITWTLSEPMTGQVEYGTTMSYGQTSVKETSFNYSTHIQSLSGLAPGTIYHFRVRSANQAGVEVVSGDYTFTTTSTSPSPPTLLSCAPAPTSSLVINVKDTGAKGDGITDDTAAIQAAVNQVAGTGGTVLVPDGTYLINGISNGWDGINLKSNMTLQMTSGAILKEIPNASNNSSVIGVNYVSNVNIIGGTVQGERAGHSGTTGECGMGININGSSNIVIDSVTTRDAWGDGIYIGEASIPATNVTVCNVTSDNNRRQGMSITSADGVLVKNSIFKNTNGTLPEAGIDMEPDGNAPYVKNVKVLSSQFINNAGDQISVYAGDQYQGIKPMSGITIDSNTTSTIYPVRSGSSNSSVYVRNTNGVTVTNNNITTPGYVIEFNSSSGNILTGNTANTSALKPYVLGDDGSNTITGNVFP